MDRRILVAGAAGVLALAVVLLVALRDDHPTLARTTEVTESPTPTPTQRERPPSLSTDADPPVVTGAEPGGTRIRDHRTGERSLYQPRPRTVDTVHTVHKDRLPAALVHDISDGMKTVMAACTAAIPADGRGPTPRVEGAVFVDVTNGQLTIKETSIVLRDLTGDPSATAQRCIEARWVGLSTPAGTTPETSDYAIRVLFAVASP